MNGISLLKCICDETRFGILELLQKNKELCVNDFVEKLKKDQPLVSSRDEGKKAMYSISNDQLSVLISNITNASKKIPVLCSEDSCC